MLGINQARYSLQQNNAKNNQSQPQFKFKTLDKHTVSFKCIIQIDPKSEEGQVINAVRKCIKSFNSNEVDTIQAYAEDLLSNNDLINRFLREEADLKKMHPRNVTCLGLYLGKFDAWADCVTRAGHKL